MHNTISSYFEGKLTAEEKVQLFEQIKTDSALKEQFIAMQNLYGMASWLPSETDEAEAIGKLLAFKQQQASKAKRSFPWKHLFGYAAAILLSIGSTTATLYMYKRTEWVQALVYEEPETHYEEFTAPPGQRALIKLHDGSTVWLNARTTLRYPNHFSRNERRVELNGEAYFEVKENKEQPFIVETEKLNIQVTGTSFNVFAYHGQSEFNTSLLKGSVFLYAKNNASKTMELRPNERAVLIENQLTKQPFNQLDFLLWKDGIYAFDDLSFEAIKKKLELYYDISIIVKNNELDTYKFSGKFRQRDGIESVLRTLQKIKKFNYTKDEDKNIITIL